MAKRKLTAEGSIRKACKDILDLCGWFNHGIQQSMGSYKGIADHVAMKDGRMVWIEFKTPKGKLSEHQLKYQRDCGIAGIRYIVIRDPLELVEYLRGIGDTMAKRMII